MKTRYFVRVVKPFAIYRADHEICLEEDEYTRAKDAVVLTATEVDGKMIPVDAPAAEGEGEPKPGEGEGEGEPKKAKGKAK